MEAVMVRITAFRIAFALASLVSILFLTDAPLAQTGAWSHKAPMPGVRSETATAVVDGKIYVIGGNTSETPPGETSDGKPVERYDAGLAQVYDPTADTWRPLAPMPDGAGHAATAVL